MPCRRRWFDDVRGLTVVVGCARTSSRRPPVRCCGFSRRRRDKGQLLGGEHLAIEPEHPLPCPCKSGGLRTRDPDDVPRWFPDQRRDRRSSHPWPSSGPTRTWPGAATSRSTPGPRVRDQAVAMSWSTIARPTPRADAGFWPVMRRPSVTTFSVQLGAGWCSAPRCFSVVASR